MGKVVILIILTSTIIGCVFCTRNPICNQREINVDLILGPKFFLNIPEAYVAVVRAEKPTPDKPALVIPLDITLDNNNEVIFSPSEEILSFHSLFNPQKVSDLVRNTIIANGYITTGC